MTLVTVAIPTRNRPALLELTVRSVLAQEERDLEVVIIDDGSDEAVAPQIAALAGGPVRVLRNVGSRGVATARNQGAEAGHGTWVSFLDDDDLWAPDKVPSQLAAVAAADCAWTYGGAVKFAAGPVVWQIMPPPSSDDVVRRLAHKNVVPAGASNVLADRRRFLELGGFDTDLAHLADWDMWLRLLEDGPPVATPDLTVGYRLHTGAMSLDPTGILAELAVLDRRWAHLRGGRRLDPGPTHLWIAMSWLRAGRRARAALSYAKASRTRPRQGLRGVARTCHPRPPTPAHDSAGNPSGPTSGRAGHTVPPRLRQTLDELAGAGTETPAASPPRQDRGQPRTGRP